MNDDIDIEKITPNDDWTLTVSFTDGAVKTYDVKPKVFDKGNRDYKWFKKLQDIHEFRKVVNWAWTAHWDDNTDLSAYELYVNGV